MTQYWIPLTMSARVVSSVPPFPLRGDFFHFSNILSARSFPVCRFDHLAVSYTHLVSRQAVSKWEADRSRPELDKLAALASLYGVTLDELAGREPSSLSLIHIWLEANQAVLDENETDEEGDTFRVGVPKLASKPRLIG